MLLQRGPASIGFYVLVFIATASDVTLTGFASSTRYNYVSAHVNIILEFKIRALPLALFSLQPPC